jgi:Cys-rich protein (TIGR01571 family)
MVVPWQAGLVFVGLTGLPHPNVLHSWATRLLPALQINLPGYAPIRQDQMHGEIHGGCDAKCQEDVQQMANIMLGILIFIVVLFVAQIVAVCMYKSKVHDAKPALGDNLQTMATGNFHYGLFDCFTNMNECLCSLFCTSVRYADTHSATSNGGFWGSFCAFVGINAVISAASTMIVAAVNPPPPTQHGMPPGANQGSDDLGQFVESILRGLAFGILARKKLRAKLGDTNPGKSAFTDFLAWGWCPCCALTQESVEADIAADVTISCPFTLTKGRVRAREVAPTDLENLLGDALLVEGR